MTKNTIDLSDLFKYDKGKLISIEGIDGVGKTTQVAMLVDRINRECVELAHSAKEPADTEVGKRVRELICHFKIDDDVQQLLISAARVDNLRQFIIPKIQQGKIVVIDRFVHTSFAYHNTAIAEVLHRQFAYDIMPDLTFILDVDTPTAKERIQSRVESRVGNLRHYNPDLFDDKIEYEVEQQREKFLSYVDGTTVIKINASQKPHEVLDDIWEHVLPLIKARSIPNIQFSKAQLT